MNTIPISRGDVVYEFSESSLVQDQIDEYLQCFKDGSIVDGFTEVTECPITRYNKHYTFAKLLNILGVVKGSIPEIDIYPKRLYVNNLKIEFVDKGSKLIPLDQLTETDVLIPDEAYGLVFETSKVYAIKIGMDDVNILTGERWSDEIGKLTDEPQNFITCYNKLEIDELDHHASLQFEVFEMEMTTRFKVFHNDSELDPYRRPIDYGISEDDKIIFKYTGCKQNTQLTLKDLFHGKGNLQPMGLSLEEVKYVTIVFLTGYQMNVRLTNVSVLALKKEIFNLKGIAPEHQSLVFNKKILSGILNSYGIIGQGERIFLLEKSTALPELYEQSLTYNTTNYGTFNVYINNGIDYE